MKRSPASTPNKKIAAGKFDPFSDRLSRDIRNTLSEAFIDALSRMEPSAYRDEADIWRAKNPSEIYLEYIQNRLQSYDQVFKQIKVNQLVDPLLRSLVIWNNGLFFEFHDHLEGIWIQATGDKKQALKGLIKAAGAYIHNEYGRQEAVKSISVKSRNLIRQYSHCLTFITNLDVLIQKLIALDTIPPRLENPALRED
ncbi:MAG: DUF309 domain-containing protein [Proteobacteria bacterium]|nr:DUF309 domain-containing protein [Pseudomonadota bacterium]